MTGTLPNYKSLSVPERIRLVGDIWDSIADDTLNNVPLSDAQASEIERRVEAHLEDPASGVPWVVVKEKLFAAPV